MELADNKGTIVVEMCIIMPIVIVIVMMAINMMIVQVNRSAAAGSLYVTSCNRAAYLSAKDSAEKELTECLEQGISSYMQFATSITADASYKKDSKNQLSDLAGTLTLRILYEESHPGMALLFTREDREQSITVHKRIRNTEGNLRRWQIYGSIL